MESPKVQWVTNGRQLSMSVNNFELIKPLLNFDGEDTMYFCQVYQRKKDHGERKVNGTNNNNRLIKAYYIRSLEYLEFVEPEIIELSNVFKARAGIDLNRRSYKKLALHCLRKIADQIANGDYNKVYKAYPTVCGKYSNEDKKDKKWIIDVDGGILNDDDFQEFSQYLENIRPLGKKVVARIPSNSGEHIISTPFDYKDFLSSKKWSSLEIHKKNPTNLYIPTL